MSQWSPRYDAASQRSVAGEDTPYTAAEVAARTGVDTERMERLMRAVGLRWPDPDEKAFGESDIAVFESFALASSAFGEEPTLHFSRAAGVAMARVAHAAVSLALVTMGEALRGRAEEEQLAGNEMAAAAFDSVPPVLERLFRQHAVRALQRWQQHRDSEQRYDVQPLAVGFVDLVGFTEQTRDLDAETLAELVVRFEARAYDAVADAGGDVVKLIGDAVMFVADTADDGCRVALALDGAFSDGDVTPRGGLAYGPVIARGGDYYGPIVNMASRLAGQAVPGEVLVTRALRDAAGPAAAEQLEPAGRRSLKGFADPVETFSLGVDG